MKKVSFKMKKWVLLILPAVSFQVFAQDQVRYEILNNTPYSYFMDIAISPLDFRLVGEKPMGGPGASISVRPISRVKLDFCTSIGLYMNEAKDLDGIKGSGGIFLDGGGTFMWMRRGKNMVTEKGSTTPEPVKFRLGSSSNGSVTVTKYINFPMNRMVERGLRGGGYFYNFPVTDGFSTLAGAYFGISKTSTRTAKLKFESGDEKLQFDQLGYYMDFLFGQATFFDGDSPESRSNTGFRFGLEGLGKGGLIPISYAFELGGYPDIGFYMRLKLAGNIAFGEQMYKGEYRYRKRAKRKIPALIQGL